MEQTVKIHVLNNCTTVEVPLGANLEEVYQLSGLQSLYKNTLLRALQGCARTVQSL